MQKIKDFCKRHRLLWLTLLVALAAAAVAAWAGFDLGQRVDNQPVYEIVNDDYTRTVVIPATADAATQDGGTTGLYLPVPLKSGQRIYGVRLDLTTHNWAFRHGTLYAALLDADGNAVANGELDCITIKDDTFAAITFDAPYTAPGTADAEADYDLANPNMTLRLWYTPGDDWDVYHLLGLWTDADTSQQMTRRNANGTTDSVVGHPALQYVVNDSGSWSHVISRLLGVLIFAAVVAGFILLTHRAKLWQVVLGCGAVLGVAAAFAFLLPANAPWWLVMLGAALAIGLGKMAFGGLGANAVNTALVGWAMLYVSWPALMDPNSMQLDTSFIDPLVRLKYFGAGAVSHIGLTDLLLGNQIGGLGASQAGALFIGGSYLAARGTIRWEIALSFFVGVFLTAALYNVIDAERFATPFFHLCTGSTFLGGFFLATEWASSPGRQIPMMLYGLIGGAMVIIIRVYGIYPDGVPFAILLINLLAPLLDSIHPKPFGAR